MKLIILICFFVAFSSCFPKFLNSKPKQTEELRLIEFNETYRKWMTLEDALKLAEECGKPDQGDGFTGFMDVTDYPNKPQEPIPFTPYSSVLTFEPKFKQLNSSINADNIRQNIEHLQSYTNRYYTSDTGVEAAKWIQNKFLSYIPPTRKDTTVALFDHSWKQSSVIATIKGKSAEKVIVGAHEDSIVSNMGVNTRAPGADDDASGTSTVLEVFRVLVSDPTFIPDKTVEFHTYSAEEVGLRGSQDIATSYRNKNLAVRAMLQFDMTGYKSGQPAFVNDYVNADLTKLVKTIAAKATTVTWIDTTCGYGCSDHASFTSSKYPSVFPFETAFKSSNSKIHTASDLYSNLNLDQCREFAALGVAFVLQLSA